MNKKIKDWKKKEPFLIIILCLAIILVVSTALTKMDMLQTIFDPGDLVSDQRRQEEEFDPVGYGLKENDETSDGEEDSEENRGDSLEQQSNNQLRKLDSLAPDGGYRGTKTTKDTKENGIIYIDNETGQGEEIADSNPVPGKQVPSDRNQIADDDNSAQDNTEQEDNSGNDAQDPEDENDNGHKDTEDETDDDDNKPSDAETEWALDDISVAYYRNKDAVLLYKEQTPSVEYIKGNLTVTSYWHEKGNSANEKTETEKEFALDAIPEEYAHKLTVQDVGKSFTLNLEFQGIKKQIQCEVENDTISYISMKVRYKSTPTYVAGETLTKANIQDAIQLDVYGKTVSGKQDVYLSDQKNYEVIFKEQTGGIASKNPDSETGEWTADIEYYGTNEGNTAVLQPKKDAVTYEVKNHKLTVMYDENTVLDVIYTDDNSVVLNKEYDGISPYNKMIQMLQTNGRYGVNEDGYLTELFFGWSPYPSVLEGENISYEFKEGQNTQTMYPISMGLIKEGYLVKQDRNDQVLVGYLGGGFDNGSLEIPYGITRVKLDKNFRISDQASSVKEIVLSETVNSVNLSAAGDKFTGLESYQVAKNNCVFESDESGLLYSEDGTILWKVPVNVSRFSVKDSVTTIAAGALNDVAASSENAKKTMELSAENPPVLEKTSDGKAFGGSKPNMKIVVKDTEDNTKIKDVIYKRYVSSWGETLDEEMGRAGAATDIIQTADHVENDYENNGGNVYSREAGKKILEFIPEDTGSYYEVESDVSGIGSCAFMEAEKVQFIKISDSVRKLKTSSLESEPDHPLQGVEIEGAEKISLEEKVLGETMPAGFHIYLSAEQSEVSDWVEYLINDYGQEKAEEIIVYAEGNLWIDDQGCVYLMEDDENKHLTLCSVPVSIEKFVEPEGYHITKISEGAFAYCDKLVYLELPEVSVVEKDAFKGCSNLEIVVLTDRALDFAEKIFDGCDSLETLLVHNQALNPKLPEQIQLLQGEEYFAEKGIVYKNVENDKYQVVNVLTSTKGNVQLKAGTTEIGERAFSGCDLVTGFYENQWEEIERIGDYAFRNCSGITELILGERCRQLGDGAFEGCDSLETVQWLGDTQTVGDAAFAQCKKLEWLYFGDGTGQTITTTGNRTFENCTELKMIYLWASVKEIGDSCFRGCSNVRASINEQDVPGLQKIGSYAFADCTNLAMNLTWFTGLTTLGEGAFLNCSYLKSTEIPEKVQSIPDYCFAGCADLKTFAIRNTSEIKSIGKGAFSGCTKLERVMNMELLAGLAEIKEYAFSSCQIGGRKYEACTGLTNIQLPESLEKIGKAAFAGCTSLWEFNGTKATLLEELGESALEGCSSLTDVSLSETKITTLAQNLFYGCSALKCLTLPETLESIQRGSLSYCTKLSEMIIKNSEKMVAIDHLAMWKSWANQTLRIYVPVTENHALLKQYRNSGYWQVVLLWRQNEIIQEMTLEDDTFIENGGIYNPLENGTYQLEKVISTSKGTFTMKDNTTQVAEDAFAGCDKMTMIVLAGSLQSIPDGVFAGCSSLEALILAPGAAPEWEGTLFGDREINAHFAVWKAEQDECISGGEYPVKCYGTNCHLYEGVLYGSYVENDITRVSLQYIPKTYEGELNILYGTKIVAGHAGESCKELTAVNSVGTVEKIGAYAFAGCTSLQKVDLTSTSTTSLKEIGDYAFMDCTSLNGKNTSSKPSETQLLLPSTLQKYGKGMLKGCTSLTSVAMWGVIHELPDELCSGCVNLKTISMSSTILKGIERIGEKAFYNCKGITSISWSNMPALKTVAESAYEGCSSLVQATFADQIQSLGNRCFYGTNLEMISFNGQKSPSFGKNLMEETIQEQVNIFVPAGKDGEIYLSYYNALQQEYPILASGLIAQNGSAFRAVSNILYLVNPENTTQLTAMKVPTNLSSVTIYNGTPYCVGLGDSSFRNCAKLTAVTIPNRVTFIGERTFENCTSLKQITIQGNVIKTIGKQAFLGCQSMETLTLPDSVDSLGERMLEDCSSFRTLYLNSFTPSKLGSKIFGEKLNKNIRIVVPLGSYEDYIKIWGSQLDKEYGKGAGVLLIQGLSETEKIENGIAYQYINGQWIEKDTGKSDRDKEEKKAHSKESTTETNSSDDVTTEQRSAPEETSTQTSDNSSQEEKATERKESTETSELSTQEESTEVTEPAQKRPTEDEDKEPTDVLLE